ncbi:MAG: ParB/RepB/Spo0J family partition protein [Phycisphaerales bacterium]|nr:ParB/RepB/Spo0J family partition protein [Phycisphaerales bacterium]
MSNQDSSTTNDSAKIDIPVVSGSVVKPIAPQVPLGKLGRGLGRLIPIKNTQQNAEKSSVLSVDPKSPILHPTEKLSNVRTDSSRNIPSSVELNKETKVSGVVFGNGVDQIDISKIRPNPRQPRTDFKTSELEGLATSIKSNGLLQPIIVRPLGSTDGQYEIVAGERRWRAFKMLGKIAIAAIIVQASDEHSGVCALIENVHRTDLNPMDRALAILRLSEEFSLTHDKLAEKLSLDRSTVTNLLRLADLDTQTASLVRQGLLTQGHAKSLLGVLDIKARHTLAESTVRGEWSVRALEREVQRLSAESKGRVPRGTQPARRQANVKDLETRLSQLLGTRVTIQLGRKPNTGKVSMEFFSLDQFEGMLAKFGLRTDQIRFEN